VTNFVKSKVRHRSKGGAAVVGVVLGWLSQLKTAKKLRFFQSPRKKWAIYGPIAVELLTLIFRHNRSCGLAASLLFFLFQGSFLRFQKQNPKTRKQVLAREVCSPAIFFYYILPPHPLLIEQQITSSVSPRISFDNAAAGGQNLPLPLHGPIFALVFFTLKTHAYLYA
jgi:hypothetical protein